MLGSVAGLCALRPRWGFLLVGFFVLFIGQKFKITWWIGFRISPDIRNLEFLGWIRFICGIFAGYYFGMKMEFCFVVF
jgi:hypothetical protein